MKYFIVARNIGEFCSYATEKGFNDNDVFFCENFQRAKKDVELNKRKGIKDAVIVIAENFPFDKNS